MSDIKIDNIIKSNRRTIGLEIDKSGCLIIRAPRRVSLHEIKDVVESKRKWIIEKQKLVKDKIAKSPIKEFLNGNEFYCMGKLHKLIVTENTSHAFAFRDNNFIIKDSQKRHARRLFIYWYQHQAAHFLSRRIQYWTNITNLKFKSLKISNAKKRYGSCSSRGAINLSWRLILAPVEIIDYVIVHELCHLEHLNHSRKFWNKVESILPNYKNDEDRLKKNSHLLEF
jgi:predicted metal-dependent hydrolase